MISILFPDVPFSHFDGQYLLPMLESWLVSLRLVPAEKDLANGVPAADEIVVADGYVLHS